MDKILLVIALARIVLKKDHIFVMERTEISVKLCIKRLIFYPAGVLLMLSLCIQLSACTLGPITVETKNINVPGSSGGSPQGSTNEGQIARAVSNAINSDRAAAKLPALKWSNQLAASAHQHDLAMKAANNLAHQLPNEAALGDREHQQGVQWWWAAENIGETTDQSQDGALGLHKAMMAEQPPEDGHRQNILTNQGTLLGVDILIDNQNHKLWLTEDFART